MNSDADFGLPRELGDGLLLRWATPADAEEVADFNVRIHSDNPDEPEEALAHWTRDLMNGRHPTTRAGDFTVVVDQNRDNKIVSSLNLISQTWTYAGILFGCGRPELVGTDPEYRRRGLVRAQMTAVHAKSAARGELVQAITGIPWYYRLFGYEMGLDLGGSRQFFWSRPGNRLKSPDEEPYQMRPVTVEDIPVLQELYAAHCAHSLVSRVRDETLWRYELTEPHEKSFYHRNMHLIETMAGEAVAYVEYRQWGTGLVVREMGVRSGHSWRAVGLFVARKLKEEATQLNKKREKAITNISFHLGAGHPIYEALGRDLEKQIPAYAWYIRVPDLPAFLRLITPVLEERLAQSVLAGHSGEVKITFYHDRIKLVFKQGKLTEIGTYEAKRLEEGDAGFPDLTFLQLLFGHRPLDALIRARADCYARDAETAVLLNILFPHRHSHVVGLG